MSQRQKHALLAGWAPGRLAGTQWLPLVFHGDQHSGLAARAGTLWMPWCVSDAQNRMARTGAEPEQQVDTHVVRAGIAACLKVLPQILQHSHSTLCGHGMCHNVPSVRSHASKTVHGAHIEKRD
eukprot:jgi/Ulvmu1/5528/UM023_0064.1